MKKRVEILNSFYGTECDEDVRLAKSRHGQLEYLTTMHYIHKFLPKTADILEIGAGTGRYSIELAKRGYRVTAVELAEENYRILRQNSRELDTLTALQMDAIDLSGLKDDTFDLVLVLGPLYHLYETKDQSAALNEAIRVTKPCGIIMTAFLSVHAIMYTNYLQGNWHAGMEENFTDAYCVKHFEEQVFTGFDVVEFESLFDDTDTRKIATVATDGILELVEGREDFSMSDDEFASYAAYHLHHCEKRELLGCSNHLLYICEKRPRKA